MFWYKSNFCYEIIYSSKLYRYYLTNNNKCIIFKTKLGGCVKI